MRNSAFVKSHCDIRKVNVNITVALQELYHTRNRLAQNIINLAERLFKRNFWFRTFQLANTIVRDNNKRVNVLFHLGNSAESHLHFCLTLPIERLGNNANSKYTLFLGNRSHNGSRACTGAAAHTCCNKKHRNTVKYGSDIIAVFLCGSLTFLRVVACALTACCLASDLDTLHLAAIFFSQCGNIGICNNVLNIKHATVNHVRRRISACAANAKHHDFRIHLKIICQIETIINIINRKSHNSNSPPAFYVLLYNTTL